MATPPVGRHGIVSVNEEKPRKLPQLECHPLSSMRVKIELLTANTYLQARHNGQSYVFALLTGYRDPPAGVSVAFFAINIWAFFVLMDFGWWFSYLCSPVVYFS